MHDSFYSTQDSVKHKHLQDRGLIGHLLGSRKIDGGPGEQLYGKGPGIMADNKLNMSPYCTLTAKVTNSTCV